MVISELRKKIADTLRDAGKEDYRFEADQIVCDILDMNKTALITHPGDEADPQKAAEATETAEKRASGYPLQYLLGKWDFYGCTFKVGEGVLIPRPDTEILVDTVREKLKGTKAPRIADLCSGSGCIAIALKKNIPDADITAVELSEKALPYLIENARANDAVIRYIHGDVMNGALLDKFSDEAHSGNFIKCDCIVSNPPYLTGEEMADLQAEVQYEPAMALDGGRDGLKFYRVIACLWKEILKEGGIMAFEIGYRQGEQVSEIMRKSGFSDIEVIKDLGGNDRVVCGHFASQCAPSAC